MNRQRKVGGSGPRNESLIFSGKATKGDGEGSLGAGRLGRGMSSKDSHEDESGKTRTAFAECTQEAIRWGHRSVHWFLIKANDLSCLE